MTLILLIRAGLAAMLAASGAAKLADVDGFAHAVSQLAGVDRSTGIVRAGAVSVGIVEVALALASFSLKLDAIVDAAILVLMLGFVLVAVFAMARRSSTQCRCFGALSRSRFDSRMLARNLVLVGAAASVLLTDGVNDVDTAWVLLLVVAGGLFAVACSQAARALDAVQRVPQTQGAEGRETGAPA